MTVLRSVGSKGERLTIIRTHALGVIPSTRRNAVVIWAWLEKPGRGGNVGKAWRGAAARGSFNQQARSCDTPLHESHVQRRTSRCPKRAGEIGFREADVGCKVCQADFFGEPSLEMVENTLQAP